MTFSVFFETGAEQRFVSSMGPFPTCIFGRRLLPQKYPHFTLRHGDSIDTSAEVLETAW